MDTATKDRILDLYYADEISEYAARELLDDDTIDRFHTTMNQPHQTVGQQRDSSTMTDWPDEVPLPYGHLPQEEYYQTDSLADD